MIPQHIYDAIIESPAGKLISRLIVEEHARNRFLFGEPDLTPGAHGSIIDQLYETITTAQKKYRRDRAKASNQDRLAKYREISRRLEPNTMEWLTAHGVPIMETTDDSDE